MIEKQCDVKFRDNIYSVYGEMGVVSMSGICGLCDSTCSNDNSIGLTNITEFLNANSQVEIQPESGTWQVVVKRARQQEYESQHKL